MWFKKLIKSKSYVFKKEEKLFTARLQNERILTKSYSVFDLNSEFKENVSLQLFRSLSYSVGRARGRGYRNSYSGFKRHWPHAVQARRERGRRCRRRLLHFSSTGTVIINYSQKAAADIVIVPSSILFARS